MMLDLTGRTVAVIGGGAVAARKARGLIEAGAKHVRCVAPAFCDEFPVDVERCHEVYRTSHLEGVSLVFVATDQPEVNQAVVQDAHARNLLVNRADQDDEEPGDFVLPASLRRGELLISVSVGSPALSAAVRERLAGLLDPRWEQMGAAMRTLRPMIKCAGLPITTRRQIFREMAGEEALNVLQARGPDGLRAWLLHRHPELSHA